MGGEIEVKYRVYYKLKYDNIDFDDFWYTDAYENVDDARSFLEYKQTEIGFVEGHIKQEVTTKIIVEEVKGGS